MDSSQRSASGKKSGFFGKLMGSMSRRKKDNGNGMNDSGSCNLDGPSSHPQRSSAPIDGSSSHTISSFGPFGRRMGGGSARDNDTRRNKRSPQHHRGNNAVLFSVTAESNAYPNFLQSFRNICSTRHFGKRN